MTRSCHLRSVAFGSLRIGLNETGIGLKDIVIILALFHLVYRYLWLSNSSEAGQVVPLKTLGSHFC